jgi:hypothetical protein
VRGSHGIRFSPRAMRTRAPITVGSSLRRTAAIICLPRAQQGPFFVEELGRKHPGTLYQFHQDWVETLARAAEREAARCAPELGAKNRASP